MRELALAPDSPHFTRIAALAKQHQIAICPAYPELVPATASEPARAYNAVSCFDASGKKVAHYRKTHLWSSYEQAVFTAGEKEQAQNVFELQPAGIRVGFLICYDVEVCTLCAAVRLL